MFIIGLSLIGFSVPFGTYMFYILSLLNSGKYRLTGGATKEQFETYAILCVLCAIVGVILTIFGWIKRKNKAALSAIENSAKVSRCRKCGINVSGEKCPSCGAKLNKGE